MRAKTWKYNIYLIETSGRLSLIHIFLIDDWIGVDASINYKTGQPVLKIVKVNKLYQQPLEFDN